MKTRFKTITLALFALSSISSMSFAQSNGTHGGRGVLLDQKLRLRDMVNPGTCSWQSGETLLTPNKWLKDSNLLTRRLKKVAALNWYAELLIRREIRRLDFCFSHAQLNLAATDINTGEITDHSILLYQDLGEQIPIGLRVRAAKEVYFQIENFNELSADDQVQLILHETLHSFMPLNLDSNDYYQKLESIVKTIGEIEGTPSTERRNFETAIRKSQLEIPSTSQFLDDQSFLAYLFESYEGRRAMILSHQIDLSTLLIPHSFTYEPALHETDQGLIEDVRRDPKDVLFLDFCEANDNEVLSALRAQSAPNFNIDLYCMTTPGAIDRFVKNPAALDNGTVSKFLTTFYQGLARISPSIHDGRIVLSKELDWISGNPAIKPRFRYALETHAAFKIGNEAESHLTQFSRLLVSTALVKSPESWLALVKQGSAFQEAFNWKRVENEMNRVHSDFTGEDEQAKKQVKYIYSQALRGVVKHLQEKNRDEHADLLVNYIKSLNNGIEVENE